ncbi:MAG: response regulator [Polyangiaceae bacterium]
MRALVVDDSPIKQDLVRGALEGEGYEVVVADAGAASTPLFEVGVFGLELPDTRGERLAADLLARGVIARAVFFTSSEDPDRLKAASQTGIVIDAGDVAELASYARYLGQRLALGGTPTEPPKPPPLTGALRVLVVDDEPLIARATARMLRARGHSVHVATSFAVALELTRLERFDVAVLDLDMEGEANGIHLAKKLLAAARAERVVFYSGSQDVGLFMEATQLGRVVAKGARRAARWLVRDVEATEEGEGSAS